MQPIPGFSAGMLGGAGGLGGLPPLTGLSGAASGAASGGSETSFKNLLVESIGHVNEMQVNADHAVEQLLSGGDANAAEVLTAMQKADMSFRLMLQIRNKLTEAFQQVQAIQI